MEEIRVRSNINRVAVYPDRALITRRCFVELDPGPCEIIFEQMPAGIIPGTLRAKAKIMGDERGSPGIRLLSLEHLPGEAMDGVPGRPTGRRKKLVEDRERVRNRLENLRLRRSFFLGVASRSRDHISRQLVEGALSLEDCDRISDFLFQTLAKTAEEVRKVQAKERDQEAKIALSKEEEDSSPRTDRLTHLVRVGVHAPSKVKGILELTYVITGAGWSPFYEIHAAPGDDSIRLYAYGVITQMAGEPWPDVKISLSTAPPPIGAGRPELEPLILQPPSNGEEATRSNDGEAAGGASGQASFVPEGAVWNFEVARPGTILSDGSPARALIGKWDLKADYECVCVPRISESAFLRARLKNTRRADLLPGKASVFSNSDFIGSTEIPHVAPSEEFDVYVGIDPGVRVRHQVERQAKGKAGVISKVHRKGIKVSIHVQNQKNRERPVVLMDRMPISGHKEIRVRDAKFSMQPKKKSRDGILIWSFNLKPREKREITYSYTVEHPRGMPLQI